MVYASGDSLGSGDGSEYRTIYSANRLAIAETVNKSSEVSLLRKSYGRQLNNFESKKDQIIEKMRIDGYMGSAESATDLSRLRGIKAGITNIKKSLEEALDSGNKFADELLSILNDTAGSQNA
jgi:hypothetical protein